MWCECIDSSGSGFISHDCFPFFSLQWEGRLPVPVSSFPRLYRMLIFTVDQSKINPVSFCKRIVLTIPFSPALHMIVLRYPAARSLAFKNCSQQFWKFTHVKFKIILEVRGRCNASLFTAGLGLSYQHVNERLPQITCGAIFLIVCWLHLHPCHPLTALVPQ